MFKERERMSRRHANPPEATWPHLANKYQPLMHIEEHLHMPVAFSRVANESASFIPQMKLGTPCAQLVQLAPLYDSP